MIKRNFTKLFSSILLFILSLVLIACDKTFPGDNGYIVNFIADDSIYYSITVNDDNPFNLPTEPTKDGYTFMGWLYDGDYINIDFVVSDNLVLVADFAKNITIRFYVEDDIYTTIQTNANSVFEFPSDPVLDERLFVGWFYKGTVFTNNIALDDDFNLHAKFNDKVNINFYVDEELIDTLSVFKDDEFEFPSNPVKDGYVFNGWLLNGELFNENTTLIDLELHASFSKVLKVDFFVDNSLIHSIDILENETFSYPDEPVKDGYLFNGWYLDGMLFEEYTTTVNLELHAEFIEIEGIVISFYKGPILLKQVPHLAGEAFDPKLIAKEAGYNFKKWYTDANLVTPFDERTVVKNSITLYGDWYDFNTELDGYYRNLPYGLSGNDLRTTLQGILQDTINPRTYGEVRFILAHSDRYYQTNYESVRGIYDDAVIATYWIHQGAGAWQREHVWPQSKLKGSANNNSSRNDASDLHNLRAITGINQTKSDHYFIEGSGAARNINTGEFYAGDGHQGDSARILYYMELMYSYLTLTDDISLITGGGTYYGKLTPLLNWHYEDPVDRFEIERNEFIYSGIAIETVLASPTPTGRTIAPQANRNPFIDLPYLAYILWGNL